MKRRAFKGKKGFAHDYFFNVIELVLAAIILIELFLFVNDVASQTIFEKNYLARDIGLLMNSMYAAPGSIEYSYLENTKDNSFEIEIKENAIEIGSENAPIYYPFSHDKDFQFLSETKLLQSGSSITLVKNQNKAGVQ